MELRMEISDLRQQFRQHCVKSGNSTVQLQHRYAMFDLHDICSKKCTAWQSPRKDFILQNKPKISSFAGKKDSDNFGRFSFQTLCISSSYALFLNACFLCNLGRFDLWEKLLVLSLGNFSPYSNCLFATRVHEESLKYKNIEILSMRYRYVISLTLMKRLPGIMIMIFWTLQLQTKQD